MTVTNRRQFLPTAVFLPRGLRRLFPNFVGPGPGVRNRGHAFNTHALSSMDSQRHRQRRHAIRAQLWAGAWEWGGRARSLATKREHVRGGALRVRADRGKRPQLSNASCDPVKSWLPGRAHRFGGVAGGWVIIVYKITCICMIHAYTHKADGLLKKSTNKQPTPSRMCMYG